MRASPCPPSPPCPKEFLLPCLRESGIYPLTPRSLVWMEKPRSGVEQGFSKATGVVGSTGLPTSWERCARAATPPHAWQHLSLLTSFRSVLIRSRASSMRLASMKSLYLSRTQRRLFREVVAAPSPVLRPRALLEGLCFELQLGAPQPLAYVNTPTTAVPTTAALGCAPDLGRPRCVHLGGNMI